MKILVLNSGSSSQKSSLYEIGPVLPQHPGTPLWQATLEWDVGVATAQAKDAQGVLPEGRVQVESRLTAMQHLLQTLTDGETQVIGRLSEIDVVGHRVVHGGDQYELPIRITSDVKAAIYRFSEFAPLHNPAALEGIELIEQLLNTVPQIAVFDTGFHNRLPQHAAVYPGPYEWYERGIRRYGFHGINHQYCAERAAQLLGHHLGSLKIVTCHLGNGASLAAVDGGRSVDTTMGFTPLEGLMMGTRSGSVDPGILPYLMRRGHLSGHQIDNVLNHESGLLGISGVSSDMRQIQAAMKERHVRARLAFEMYVHRLQSCLGAMVAVLGGVDAIVFTAGVGENSADIRDAACSKLAFLGVALDAHKNTHVVLDEDITTSESKVRVLVIRAQEDWAIARACWQLQRGEQRASRALRSGM